MKWRLHSCPRCHGDLYIEVEGKGGDIVCLQCGAVFYPETLPEAFRVVRRTQEEPAGASARKGSV